MTQQANAGSTPLEAGGASEGCPTPLDWQQVVGAFRNERQIRHIRTSAGPISTMQFGSGPPLFLLNGFLGCHDLFALLAWVLRDEHTMVLFDWPTGDIQSRHVSGEVHLSRLARAIADMANGLGHEQWALHATSFGCLVAMQAMLDFPERICWASMQGAFASRRFSVTEKALLIAARFSNRTLNDVRPARFIQSQNNLPWFPPFDSTRWEFYAQQVGETPVRELALLASIASSVDISARLPEIKTPLLIVSCEGEGKRLIAAERRIAESTPNARMESLDHCGALPHITHPHRLAKLLRQFRDHCSSCANDSRRD